MSGRMATVPILDGATLTMPCPPWCDGHPYGTPLHPCDVLHESTDTELQVTTTRGQTSILAFGLAQAPYRLDDDAVYGTVDLGTEGPVRLTPDEIRALADGMVRHSNRLRQFAARLDQLHSPD